MMWCQRQMKMMETCDGCKKHCSYRIADKEQGGKVYCFVEKKQVYSCLHMECIRRREKNNHEHV